MAALLEYYVSNNIVGCSVLAQRQASSLCMVDCVDLSLNRKDTFKFTAVASGKHGMLPYKKSFPSQPSPITDAPSWVIRTKLLESLVPKDK